MIKKFRMVFVSLSFLLGYRDCQEFPSYLETRLIIYNPDNMFDLNSILVPETQFE